ncbi:RNA-directed DNA polymerase from mobile element jockey [Stylophora pistillata]|uniref:RNA-directed DNA polymerase from mobile element jockey n=1 Tax=Stylophora pistillata TaxID=50429 RepID=A0A2B4RHZ6_STYPI|nr:RNA-directed DNA polymerase from mobile element jockey [Stylophora pistillata]
MVPAITSAQVSAIMMKISSHKATGIDGISARLLRIGMPAIAPCIARLINLSMSTGKFPTRWKTAKVTPLFKGGALSDPSNYRPISVLPVLSKIIERHMYNSLYAFLTEQNLIYSRQSGFRKHHSTETALIKIVDELLFNLDRNKVSGLVLVDYAKAFDMVDHELLLKKLEAGRRSLKKTQGKSQAAFRLAHSNKYEEFVAGVSQHGGYVPDMIGVAECLMKMSKYLSRMFNAMRLVRARIPIRSRWALLAFGTPDDPEAAALLWRRKRKVESVKPKSFYMFLKKFHCKGMVNKRAKVPAADLALSLDCMTNINTEVNAYNEKLAELVTDKYGVGM